MGKSKKKSAPKNVETTNDTTGAPLTVTPPQLIDTGASVLDSTLAVLENKSNDTVPPTNDAPPDERVSAALLALAPPGAASDVLNGRVANSTHSFHIALVTDASLSSESDVKIVSAKALGARQVTISVGRNVAPRATSATAPHVTAMRERKFIVRLNGAYALSNLARKLVKLAPLRALVIAEQTMYGAPTVDL